MGNIDTDLVVVGGGGSGLAAAVAAAENGSRVVVLEKGLELGGTTRLSIGSITVPETPWQRKKGYVDGVEAFVEDSRAFVGGLVDRDNRELRDVMANGALDTLLWLRDLGVSFVGPFPEPPHRVPRMHNVIPGSRAYILVLARRAKTLGVDVRTGFRATKLVHVGRKVVGVRAQSVDGSEITVSGRHGVVIATGDFSASAQLKEEYLGAGAGSVPATNRLSTGDGHVMASEAGADLVNMDICDGPQLRFGPPRRRPLLDVLPNAPVFSRLVARVAESAPPPLARFIAKQMLTARMAPRPEFLRSVALVNRDGARFINESAPHPEPAYAVAGQPGAIAYLILDQRVADRFSSDPDYISTAPGIAYAFWPDYRRARGDLVASAPRLGDLANVIGADPSQLERSIRQFNELREGGNPEASTEPDDATALVQPPFYAMGPIYAEFTTTEGGIRIDVDCRVLDRNGSPIDGLFAAGSAGQGGLILSGHGMHILWAMTSGRIAARTATGQVG